MASGDSTGSAAKRPRLDDDPAVGTEPAESKSKSNIRDLIFAITGTMPAAIEPDTKGAETFAGVDCSTNAGSKVSPKKCQAVDKSDRGALCFVASADAKSGVSGTGSVSTEVDVGITEFISQHEGFSGILKQRYSDFVVNEIDLGGTVVRLTDIKQPTGFEQPPDEEEKEPENLLSPEQLSQLQELHDSKNEANEVFIPADDKEVRGRLHRLIKSKFPNLDSNMVEKDGVKHIRVKYLVSRRDRKPSCFTKSTGDYCRFVLYKENTDTLHAINYIAKCLRIQPGSFGYAGTKDRRAKTTQEVTVHRIPPARLHGLNKHLRNITLGNFRICKQPMKLGELLGNHFVILLRNVTGSSDEIEVAMRSLQDVGFINYYGMQRFGTTRVATHAVGRSLLLGQWADVVELIMKPREGDRHEMVKAREVWQSTHDARKAILALKGFECTERRLLEGLKRCQQNDIVTALSFIPRNMRLMYAHSYQSYVWNRVVSRRVKELGLVPRPGDLAFRGVIDDFEAEETEVADAAVPTPSVASNEASETDAAAAEVTDNGKNHESVPASNSPSSSRIEPILLTDENVGEFAITDVVMPLPGFDVKYPTNESGNWFREILAEDGFEPDFSFRNKIKDYSLSGGYRKMIIKPGDLSWQLTHYDDYTKPLILGDLDLINKVTIEATPTPESSKYKALRMEFSLPSSTYATMAVREVLKCGTSAAYQTTLNTT